MYPHSCSQRLGIFAHLTLRFTQLPPFHLLPHQELLISFLSTMASQVFSALTCPNIMPQTTYSLERKNSTTPSSSKSTFLSSISAFTGPQVPVSPSKSASSFTSPGPKDNLPFHVDPAPLPSPKGSGVPSVC